MFSPDFSLLVPQPDQWPLFDEVLVCAFPPVEPDPSPAALAAMPAPPSRTPPRNKNPGHIPRPRNAFMLFRSAFAAAQKVGTNVEHDNRHITRIIAHCWHRLSDAEKQVWRDKAAAEKAQHAERYPNYRFSPVVRRSKPVKRKVRRNGAEDVKRCETLAELVMSGKYGLELESAIKKFDEAQIAAGRPVGIGGDSADATKDVGPGDVPPFRSPLLPPAETASPRVPDENLLPQPVARVSHVEPQYTSTSVADLSHLFAPPSYQYYQPDAHNSVPCPRSVPCPDQYQHIMDFVQNSHVELEQLVPDLSLFSWNQSDSFSFYH